MKLNWSFQGSSGHKPCQNGPSTFRSGQGMSTTAQPHLPPPEFADLPSPTDHRPSQPVLEFISSSDHQPLLMSQPGSSTSFRSLPRRSTTPPQGPPNLLPGGAMCPMPKGGGGGGHQTLPLKSNLKKSGQKLQWHEPSESGVNRASLEELRV